MLVNENIKFIREACRYTQAHFARLLNIPVSSLKNYENTDVLPKADVLSTLANMSEMSVHDLINIKLTPENFQTIDFEPVRDARIRLFEGKSETKTDADFNERYISLQNDYIATLKRMYDTFQTGLKELTVDLEKDQERNEAWVENYIRDFDRRFAAFATRIETQNDILLSTLQKRFDAVDQKIDEIRSKQK